MKKRQPPFARITVISFVILALFKFACAPEIDPQTGKPRPSPCAEKKRIQDSIHAARHARAALPVDVPSTPIVSGARYRAIDFGLSTKGTIVKFAPSEEFLQQIPVSQLRDQQYFVHIKLDDGEVRVEKINYDAYVNLSIGDILQ